jgi:serralysin
MQLFTHLEAHDRMADAADMAQGAAPLFACNCLACSGAAGNVIDAGQGGYTPGTQAFPVSSTGTVSGADASALMSGAQWTNRDAGGKTVITYSFVTAASQFDGEQARFSSTLQEFSAANQATTRAMLASISAVCNVTFIEVADSGAQAGQIRYGYSQEPNNMGFAGYAFFPSTSAIGGDVWIGRNQASSQWDYYRADLILHETLHAIGLKHPFDGNARLAGQNDIIANTVMSYSPVAGSSNGSLSNYPTEPMVLDVQALQSLYGAASNNAGDTAYNLADASFRSSFRALWDSAGSDTLDASRVGSSVFLDLHAGARSDIGAQVKAYAYVGNNTWDTSVYTSTLALANGSAIENAIGTAFGDTLAGNELANTLQGGAGNDRLVGGGGRDFIDGGTGDDVAAFAGWRSDFRITSSAGQLQVTKLSAPGDTVTLVNVEQLEFSNETVLSASAVTPPTPEQVAEAFRLYKAAFDRLPDMDGLGYHAKSLAGGVALSDVARQFMASPEFAQRYGEPATQDFINLLYQNVLDRNADASGMSYYLDRLGSGAVTRADVLVGFSESPENQAALIGLGQIPPLTVA